MSGSQIEEIDKRQLDYQEAAPNLYAEIWWKERVEAFLDQMPSLWHSVPSLFAGGKIPFLAEVTNKESRGLPRAIRLTIERQYRNDSNIKFQQLGLEKRLHKLFVGLDVSLQYLTTDEQKRITSSTSYNQAAFIPRTALNSTNTEMPTISHSDFITVDILKLLLDEGTGDKILLEGGPGQGKSTITQMIVQIYRQQVLNREDMNPENRWDPPQKSRIPFRIELREFAEWLSKKKGNSIEEYLVFQISENSGGSQVTVDQIHDIIESSRILLVLDGLDEVGDDALMDLVLSKIAECIDRLHDLEADTRVILTTRPPALAHFKEHLNSFIRFPITPLNTKRTQEYVTRWLAVQLQHDKNERIRVKEDFEKRKNEPHVQAIAKNPMQLTVLLHFIQLKGAAFPTGRAELYKDYFRTVIDRDVEKSTKLLEQREVVEALHQFLGYKIHALTETKQADGTLSRSQLLELVELWLKSRGSESKKADELFSIGEERLGLIVALKGEGRETRYGYEIQPIREYFAAAFINEDIQGNSHEVFQLMIQRPFWKEVALFLAGLNKRNEKADLITRAKLLDKNTKWGWRQDGRNFILQLLQEGVFSEPPYLFSEALDFIFDLLDPSLIKTQNKPKELLKLLPLLINQDPSIKKQYIERLLELLQKYQESDDRDIIYPIYIVANQLLKPEEFKHLISFYRGKSPKMIKEVYLSWPLRWKIDAFETIQNSPIWHKVPSFLWIRTALNSITDNSFPGKISNLNHFHSLLVEQYTLDRNIFSIYNAIDRVRFIDSDLAIFRLINYKTLLIMWLQFSFNVSSLQSFITEQFNQDEARKAEFIYLDDEIKPVITNLINLYKNLLTSLLQRSKVIDSLKETPSVLKEDLRRPGLAGWLAIKEAAFLISAPTIFRSHYQNSVIKQLNIQDIKQFYYKNEINTIKGAPVYYQFMEDIPYKVYLKNGDLVEITDLIIENLFKGKELPFGWINNCQLTSKMVYELIEKGKQDLPAILKYLADISTLQNIQSEPLHSIQINDIISLVEVTDEQRILVGALIALSNSNILISDNVKSILKLMQVDSGRTDLVRSIFKQQNTANANKRNRNIALQVAKSIIQTPNNYSFQVVSSAAEYLAENLPMKLPSLASMENKLNIHIPSKSNTTS